MINKKSQTVVILGLLAVIGFFFLALFMINPLWKGYKFNRDIGSYCELAYEASDIDKKIEYFDICLDKLHNEDFKGHSVWWFKKPNNKLSELYEVANSLQTRLHNLKGMEKSSFEYQTGLAQVEEEIAYFLGKEEGQISGTLGNFKRAYCFKYSFTKYICA